MDVAYRGEYMFPVKINVQEPLFAIMIAEANVLYVFLAEGRVKIAVDTTYVLTNVEKCAYPAPKSVIGSANTKNALKLVENPVTGRNVI